MNNNLVLFDQNKTTDYIKKTKVMFIEQATGEVVFQGSNKIILPGSAFTAAKHFGIEIPNITPSYNTALGLENTIIDPSIRPNLDETIQLFSIGTDGCGVDQHQVYDVNYTKWCDPNDLVPFRLVNPTADLGPELRQIYFGRKQMFSGTKIGYYFKKFDTAPQWFQRYISDGTPVNSEVYSSHRTDEIESFIEIKLSISTDDCKEFFENTIGINHTKINTISLLKCWSREIGGFTYYQDIRPVTKINFPNEILFNLKKGLDIYYYVYY